MAQATKFSTTRPTATMPAKTSDVLATPGPVLYFMESTCARGMLRRQLSHSRDVLYGMPDTEFAVIATPCHFSTVPLLQIKTVSEGFIGLGSPRCCCQRALLTQPEARRMNARSEKCRVMAQPSHPVSISASTCLSP